MEKLSTVINSILPNTKNANENIPNNTVDGINALQLIGDTVTGEDFAKAEEMIQMNFGKDYPREKFQMLFQLIKEDGWTAERFIRTVKHFLKHHKYPNWTISDFFGYEVKLYSHSWYMKQINDGINADEIAIYRINGKVLFRLDDGTELPFERIR